MLLRGLTDKKRRFSLIVHQRREDQHQRMVVWYLIQVGGGIIVYHDLPVTPSFQRVFGLPGTRQLYQGGFPGLQPPPINPVGNIHVDGAPDVARVVAHERPAVDGQNSGSEEFQFTPVRSGVHPFHLRQRKRLNCPIANYGR